MENVIDFLIESGVNGLFFLGSGGEFSQMSVKERKKLAAFATDYVNKRVPVLIGTGIKSDIRKSRATVIRVTQMIEF